MKAKARNVRIYESSMVQITRRVVEGQPDRFEVIRRQEPGSIFWNIVGYFDTEAEARKAAKAKNPA